MTRSKESILSELQRTEADLRAISPKASVYPALLARQKALYVMLEPKDDIRWYAHQQRLINEAPTKKLVAFGCGGGKTRTVLRLCKDQGGTVLNVATKTVVLDRTWEREMDATGIHVPMKVVSKEAFKNGCDRADILVLDEAHFALGVTPATRWRNKEEVPKASQIHEAVVLWIRKHRPKAIYLATATPFPTPMALFAISEIFGCGWDYRKFRNRFYAYVPVIGRGVYLAKKDAASKALLMEWAKRFGAFGKLDDFFDVPPQTHKTVHVGLSLQQERAMKELPLSYPEPLPRVGKQHQLEQGMFESEDLEENKIEEIVELSKEFDKMLVFARYTRHIQRIALRLGAKTKHTVLILDGSTQDRRALLEKAEASGQTIVICQAAMGSSFELPSYRCTVFASMSYSFVDFEQALGRTLRANNLQKNLYVYLTAGKVDKAVLECVRQKKDFNDELFVEQEYEE